MRRLARRIPVVVALALLSACSLKLTSTNDILSMDGSSSGGVQDSTGDFTTPGAWDLLVTYDCTKQKSEGIFGIGTLDMKVRNADDDTLNAEHAELSLQGLKKSAKLSFRRAGTFYLGIDSRCDWRVRVIDRSPGAS